MLANRSLTLAGSGQAQSGSSASTAIRPFSVHVPQVEIGKLRRRLAETRWPDKETVADRSQGAQLATLQELVRYWGGWYDWRKAEAKLNRLPLRDPEERYLGPISAGWARRYSGTAFRCKHT